MFVLFFLARLTSTMFANGYIPVRRDSDAVKQIRVIGSTENRVPRNLEFHERENPPPHYHPLIRHDVTL